MARSEGLGVIQHHSCIILVVNQRAGPRSREGKIRLHFFWGVVAKPHCRKGTWMERTTVASIYDNCIKSLSVSNP